MATSNKEDDGWKSIPDKQIYESWGSKFHMGLSYGYKVTDANYKEDMRELIDTFKKADYEESKSSGSSNNSKK